MTEKTDPSGGAMKEQIHMPGTFVRYCGQRWKVGMVGRTGGERYYWLLRGGVVAMVPGFILDKAGEP